MVQCSRLSWLIVSFLANYKYFVSYLIACSKILQYTYCSTPRRSWYTGECYTFGTALAGECPHVTAHQSTTNKGISGGLRGTVGRPPLFVRENLNTCTVYKCRLRWLSDKQNCPASGVLRPNPRFLVGFAAQVSLRCSTPSPAGGLAPDPPIRPRLFKTMDPPSERTVTLLTYKVHRWRDFCRV